MKHHYYVFFEEARDQLTSIHPPSIISANAAFQVAEKKEGLYAGYPTRSLEFDIEHVLGLPVQSALPVPQSHSFHVVTTAISKSETHGQDCDVQERRVEFWALRLSIGFERFSVDDFEYTVVVRPEIVHEVVMSRCCQCPNNALSTPNLL